MPILSGFQYPRKASSNHEGLIPAVVEVPLYTSVNAYIQEPNNPCGVQY